MAEALLILAGVMLLAWVPLARRVRHDAPSLWAALFDGETVAWMASIGAMLLVLWLIVWGLLADVPPPGV